jgi:hypothetical protein
LISHEFGGADLMGAELGMLVQIAAPFDDPGLKALQFLGGGGVLRLRGDRTHEQQGREKRACGNASGKKHGENPRRQSGMVSRPPHLVGAA